jgi:1-acyl-sn-glycerol-3-phosphate acyltransferase
MSEDRGTGWSGSSRRQTLREKLDSWVQQAPFMAVSSLARLLWGFRVVNEENLPKKGPFILALNEYSALGMFVSGWISIVLLKPMLESNPDNVQSFMQEELWSMAFFRRSGESSEGKLKPLRPQGAGRLALGLLDGVRALKGNGLVIINPEGDAPMDGRPMPLGNALPWMALHTGAPIVPALASIGMYDIMPLWRMRPYLRGRMTINVGKPFTLCEEPQSTVTDEDLRKANERILEEFNKVRYWPTTQADWAAPPTRNGKRVQEPVALKPPRAPVVPWPEEDGKEPTMWNLGIRTILWRCPMCHTEGSVYHRFPILRREAVRCRACGTRWSVEHVVHHDFRLKVVEGHPDVVGLDMALSRWVDESKKGLDPAPIDIDGVELRLGEGVYIAGEGVGLEVYRPSPLLEGYTGSEPPRAMASGKREYSDTESLGEGRLLATDERLVWQGLDGQLDFEWAYVTSLSFMLPNVIYIRYGPVPYRFTLGRELPLRWLKYTGTLARRVADQDGHELVTTRF